MVLATIKMTTFRLLQFNLTSHLSARNEHRVQSLARKSMIVFSLILAIILSSADGACGSILNGKIHNHHDWTISQTPSNKVLKAHAGRPTRQAVDETGQETDLVVPVMGVGGSATSIIDIDDNHNNDENQSKQSSVSTSTDSIIKLLDSNYLNTSVADQGDVPKQSESMQIQSLDDASDNSLSSFKASIAKRRKQAENQVKAADWWAKITSKNKRLAGIDLVKSLQPTGHTTAALGIYKEQPLAQNSILTIRNQLLAIRDKHRLLLTRSVSQLIHLDQKLIDSYKLCLKKKMPLYAGMLYRTRSFLSRMASEVKHERQILEAIAKQAQKVLRQNISNRTLVKDYNRLTLDSSTPTTMLSSNEQENQHSKSEQAPPSSRFNTNLGGANLLHRPAQRTYTVHINEVNLKKELMKTQALIDRINASSYELAGVVDDIIYMFKLTSNDYGGRRGLSSTGKVNKYEKNYAGSVLMDIVSGMNQKGAKRLPLKFFLERYGSQGMRSTISSDNSMTTASLMDSNTSNTPELAPLFNQETNSLTHLDPTDSELAFDVPTIIEN